MYVWMYVCIWLKPICCLLFVCLQEFMWLITFLVPKGPYFLFLTIQYYWLSILYMNKCWKVIYKAELWNSFVCQNLVGCWQKSWYETYAVQLGLKWKNGWPHPWSILVYQTHSDSCLLGGPNIGLSSCEMRVKMKAGYRKTGFLMVRCRIKLL